MITHFLGEAGTHLLGAKLSARTKQLRSHGVLGRTIPVGLQRHRQRHLQFPRRQASFSSSTVTNNDQEESIWSQIRELLGYSGNDPGHWNYSPEWWGQHDGGWGRNPGQTVFSKQSQFNGLVEVTSHPASLSGFSSEGSDDEGSEIRQEWRVLRFNKFTRQSVARVTIGANNATNISLEGTERNSSDEDGENNGLQQRRWLENGQTVVAQPDCIASEYLKSMASVIAALIGLQGLYDSDQTESTGVRPLRVLCIGLGGGSLPFFLSHHFRNCYIDAVELDPVVVEAAVEAMGLPNDHPRMKLYTEDAVEFVDKYVEKLKLTGQGGRGDSGSGEVASYDLVCIDAFDGNDDVPTVLCTPEFARKLAAAMHAEHGMLLMNFHSTDVRDIANTFYNALTEGSQGQNKGCSFTVSTQKQKNLTLACVRGKALPVDAEAAKQNLKLAAVYVAADAGYRFPAGSRSCRGFVRIK